MTNWKITLAYDGTPYRGWQVQPGLPTVQGLLAAAIERTVGERVLPQGSGRTDTGVHALAQVASVALAAAIPAANLHRALNRCLPPSIRVLMVEAMVPEFHARHSAIGKTYEYRIFPLKGKGSSCRDYAERICPPILAPTVWPCPWPLDLAAMDRAAQGVVGTHDFTSFAACDPDLNTRETQSLADAEPRSNIRCITRSGWEWGDGLAIYRVSANGFLHHMVRNLVGTFVQVGAHRMDADSIPAILAAHNRSAAGPTAPASGLFLVSVDYPSVVDSSETLR
jgi:tRNA pseudouridine38-40 synthase